MTTPDEIIPDAPWYFGEISREKTNEILVDQPVGTYLVRDSTTQSGFALAVKEIDGVKRYLISYVPSSKKFKFGETIYDSFDDLIKQYSASKSPACRLVQPAPKPVYVGLHAFQGQAEHDLSFARGDLLTFIRQKKQWILCQSADEKTGWVPANYLTPFTPEMAARLRGQTDKTSVPYCEMIRFVQLPAYGKVVRPRNPSAFAPEHLKIAIGDEVQVRKILPTGFCEVWRQKDEAKGLVPINYLEIQCK